MKLNNTRHTIYTLIAISIITLNNNTLLSMHKPLSMQASYKPLEERKEHAAQQQELTKHDDPVFAVTRFPAAVQDLVKEYAFNFDDRKQLFTQFKTSINRVHEPPIAFLGDRYAVIGSYFDNYARIWNLLTLKCLHELEHTSPVHAIIITNNSIITGCADGSVWVWSITTKKCLLSLQISTGAIHTLIKLDNNHIIVAAHGDKTIYELNLNTGNTVRVFYAETPVVSMVKGGDYLIANDKIGQLYIWQIDSGEELDFGGYTKPDVTYVTLINLENGTRVLLTGSADGTIYIWHPNENDIIFTLKGHLAPIFKAYKKTDAILATYSYDGTVKFWDLQTSTCLKTIHYNPNMYITHDTKLTTNDQIKGYSNSLVGFYSPQKNWSLCLETPQGYKARQSQSTMLSPDKRSIQVYYKNELAAKLLYNLSCATLLELLALLENIEQQWIVRKNTNSSKPIKLTKKQIEFCAALPPELQKCLNSYYDMKTTPKKPSTSCAIL